MDLARQLRASPPPREPALCARVVAKHAAWWGFASYGALYAMSVMAIAAVIVAGVFESATHVTSQTALFALFVTTAPVTALLFLRWVRRRRGAVARLARDGVVVDAIIVDVSRASAFAIFEILNGSSPSGRTIRVRAIRDATATYRAFIAKPDWVAVGRGLQLVVVPDASYAIVLAPDDKDLIAWRR